MDPDKLHSLLEYFLNNKHPLGEADFPGKLGIPQHVLPAYIDYIQYVNPEFLHVEKFARRVFSVSVPPESRDQIKQFLEIKGFHNLASIQENLQVQGDLIEKVTNENILLTNKSLKQSLRLSKLSITLATLSVLVAIGALIVSIIKD